MSSSDMPPDSDRTQLPSYTLPALDQDFILGDSMRGVRFLLEYAKAEEALRNWSVRSTIVVFGSERVRENGPGRQATAANRSSRLSIKRLTTESRRSFDKIDHMGRGMYGQWMRGKAWPRGNVPRHFAGELELPIRRRGKQRDNEVLQRDDPHA